MNFCPSLSTTCCDSCAAECHFEEISDDHPGLCLACAESLDAALTAERADQFQGRSLEWFADLSPLARERKSASYEDCDYDTASLQERYQASFRVAS